MPRRSLRRQLLVVPVVALLALGCSDDGGDDDATQDPTATTSAPTTAAGGEAGLREDEVIATLNELCRDIEGFGDSVTDLLSLDSIPDNATELGNRLAEIESATERLAAVPEDERPQGYQEILGSLDAAVASARAAAEDVLAFDLAAARSSFEQALDDLQATRSAAAGAGADECTVGDVSTTTTGGDPPTSGPTADDGGAGS